ncbi:thioredoxin [Luteimonas granuli]|uniref:Thioredoxin n=1 Tax=Luteimonas granuli TaxID=1176533 RepID=A0A518N1L0_9GAMM|nr:thioredoxin [Luteimonas granuli]QDW65782.1 thioredoxin [Luteimonas granuli]
MPTEHATPHVFDATADTFEAGVLDRSLQVPVLIDFWAEWCGPCKTLGPILEKLAAEYNGAFVLAKIDVDREQQLAGAFQIRSIPTVILVRDGQPVDGFPGAMPEGQLREFLAGHGIVPAEAPATPADTGPAPPTDPHAEVQRLRQESEAAPEDDGLRLDLALALLATGATGEAGRLLDALPANLATDDRALRARAALGFAALLPDAPQEAALEAALAADPADLRARHLLGARHMVAGRHEAALEEFMEMLRRDRGFDDGLPRRALIEAFRVIDDDGLVSRYRRQMSSLLLS